MTIIPRPLFFLLLLAGPIAMAVAIAIDTTTGPDIGAYVEHVRSSTGVYLASGFLTQYGMLALIPMAVAVVALTAGTPRTVLLRAGAVLYGAYGAFGSSSVALGFTSGLVAADPALDGITPELRMAMFLGIGSSPFAVVAQILGIACMVVGLVLMTVGVFRSQVAPWWVGVLIAATLLVLVAAPLKIPAATIVFFFALPAGLLGLALTSGRRTERVLVDVA